MYENTHTHVHVYMYTLYICIFYAYLCVCAHPHIHTYIYKYKEKILLYFHFKKNTIPPLISFWMVSFSWCSFVSLSERSELIELCLILKALLSCQSAVTCQAFLLSRGIWAQSSPSKKFFGSVETSFQIKGKHELRLYNYCIPNEHTQTHIYIIHIYISIYIA